MSYAPASLLSARRFFMDTLADAGFRIDPASVGIVGDDSHAKTGTSYHLGKDALKPTSYSIVESARDRRGLTDAASALDLGYFKITVKSDVYDLRHFSRWLVLQCAAGTADTSFIREVIYSPDGKVVKRWDRLGIRTSGDDSHIGHTHESHFRDSEDQDKTAHLKRYFTEIGLLEDDDMPSAADVVRELLNTELDNPYSGKKSTVRDLLRYTPSRSPHEVTQKQLSGIAAQLAVLASQTQDVDEAAIVQGILAGLDDAVAQRFLDQLAERFNLRLVPVTSGDSPA